MQLNIVAIVPAADNLQMSCLADCWISECMKLLLHAQKYVAETCI